MNTAISIFIAIIFAFGLFWFFGVNFVFPIPEQSIAQGLLQKKEETPIIFVVPHSDLGTYLTDPKGRTLYVTIAECTGACLNNWPPYIANSFMKAEGVLGTTVMKDTGLRQYTWKGEPLYYWSEDEDAGDIKGHRFKDVWFVAVP